MGAADGAPTRAADAAGEELKTWIGRNRLSRSGTSKSAYSYFENLVGDFRVKKTLWITQVTACRAIMPQGFQITESQSHRVTEIKIFQALLRKLWKARATG
jgi:hypothetical protein